MRTDPLQGICLRWITAIYYPSPLHCTGPNAMIVLGKRTNWNLGAVFRINVFAKELI